MAVFLIPGLPWSYVFLGWSGVSIVERLGISVGLSVALVPFGLFLLNTIFDVAVDLLATLLLVLGLTLVGTLAAFSRIWFKSGPQ